MFTLDNSDKNSVKWSVFYFSISNVVSILVRYVCKDLRKKQVFIMKIVKIRDKIPYSSWTWTTGFLDLSTLIYKVVILTVFVLIFQYFHTVVPWCQPRRSLRYGSISIFKKKKKRKRRLPHSTSMDSSSRLPISSGKVQGLPVHSLSSKIFVVYTVNFQLIVSNYIKLQG